MRRVIYAILFLLCAAWCGHGLASAALAGEQPQTPALTLWYRQPASGWEGTYLPLGNGRLGCMVRGGVSEEHIQINEDSLWTGDENPSGNYDTMGAYQNFADLHLEFAHGNDAARQRVECSSGHAPFCPYEGVQAVVDNNVATKWCVERKDRPVIWTALLAQPHRVTQYWLTSANDVPERDPQSWVLQGSIDGATWIEIDRRTDEPIFAERHQRKTYDIAKPGDYAQYRLIFAAVHGTTHLQLSEIGLEGIAFDATGASAYKRRLDLDHALHQISYTLGGVAWTREYFCSAPAQAIVLRYAAQDTTSSPGDSTGEYTGKIRLIDAHDARTEISADRMTAAGSLPNGLQYESQVRVLHEGGAVRAADDGIVFEGCRTLTVLVAAGTDYRMDAAQQWRGPHPHERLVQTLDRAAATDYEQLKESHVRDYQTLFHRMRLELAAASDSAQELPTDKRLERFRQTPDDLGLETLLFQYGRYLLISSSRPGGLPANLQGLWNNSNTPPWSSDYHSNINLQMNYWLGEPANLADCHQPLLDLVWAMREPSRRATRAAFGDVRGWTARTSHNTVGGHGWKWNVPSSAWYAQHFWEHFAYGQDDEYLRERAYPMMKEVCEFWEDRLKTLPDGKLVVPNGWSPEHGPEEDGCAHDQQIVWDLFSNTIEAADRLGIDRDYREHVAQLRDRLAGPQIGRWGQLQEWMVDRDDPQDQHRHTSHLFAVYPGRQISVARTPELARAAAVSLEARGQTGDSRRSWTWPWRGAIWARLGNADKAYEMVQGLLQYNTLPNLLANHPPMQMDGNFGITAAVCEMLLQSHAGELHLLPALPAAWPEGQALGLRARGGYTVDLRWKSGRLDSVTICAAREGQCAVHLGDQRAAFTMQAGQRLTLDDHLQPRGYK